MRIPRRLEKEHMIFEDILDLSSSSGPGLQSVLCVERRGGMVLCNQDNGGLELIGEKIRFMSAAAGYNSPNISQHYPTYK